MTGLPPKPWGTGMNDNMFELLACGICNRVLTAATIWPNERVRQMTNLMEYTDMDLTSAFHIVIRYQGNLGPYERIDTWVRDLWRYHNTAIG